MSTEQEKPAGAQGETRAEFEADRMGETGARLRETSQGETLMDRAIADRDARPWNYYRLDHDTTKRMLNQLADSRAQQAEEIARLRAELQAEQDIARNDPAEQRVERYAMEASELTRRLIAAESQVQALQAQLECMVAPEERDQWKCEAQRLAGLLSEAQQRIKTLTDALLTVKANCQGHCDEFSGRVWMVAELALNGGPDKP